MRFASSYKKNAPWSPIIQAKPIAHSLDAFRESAQLLSQELETLTSTTQLGRIDNEAFLTDLTFRDHALDLISALQILPASRLLPSTSGGKNLFSDLSRLNLAINTRDFDVGRVISLLRAVLNDESDEVIWEEVYDLLTEPTFTADAAPSTPPPSGPRCTASFQQTPWSFNTGSFADTSDLRKNVDPILKDEVEDNLTTDHQDAFDTFFGQITQLREMTAAVLQSCKEVEPPLFQENVGWVEWPERCEEAAVLQFLRRHVDHFLRSADDCGFRPTKRRRCLATPNKPIPGSMSKRKLDIGLTYNSSESLEESEEQDYDWSHILVLGELKSNPREDNHSSTWLDLVRYAREVLSAKATRRFALGFTLCGSIMRLWEFDRLGVVGSIPFDINKDGEMFVSVILGYLWMPEEELGFDPTIVGEDKRYLSIKRNGRTERLYLEDTIKRQRSVAGRATICRSGFAEDMPDQRLVIKDSWEYEERPEEGLLLKEATEAGVKNVARYYHHETVHIGSRVDDVRSNVRRGLSDAAGRNPLQRRVAHAGSVTSSTTSGRSSSSIQASMPPPKRSCSDSLVKQDTQRRNRVHRRLVVRDVGKSIYEARSPRGIVTGLLGGIKGHESLLDASILHRDVSIGNIMLNMVEDDGFLIDLDLANKIERANASEAPSKTGTKVFMAIGALYGEDHNFMHDLESFFWVLFWVCVHWNGPGRSKSRTKYESWNYESTQKLAEIKKGKVDEEDNLLIPCIKELRKVVFPNGKRWLREDRQLYSRMKSILQRVMETLDTM
ncbi:hypothetical protein GQ44DRAFT_738332 [Phaeosphaeriaceae sp. PMI808]|nr:hypothetical protein GQ44DRAFT_738332 [Phaeosphaeriaceae sp. PMI808]